MVDPISFARNSRKIGTAQGRSQASSEIARAAEAPDAIPAAVEALIKKDLAKYSILQILQDDRGATTSNRPWPPAQLKKLRYYLKQMEGLLLDTQA
jgi:hypothetical protein